MKLSEIIEMKNKQYEKGNLLYHDYEIISCDDHLKIALVIDKTIKTCSYQIVIPHLESLCVVRVFIDKELAENAYNALTARFSI